ncbi:glycosyltransferase [Massilia sp. DWR3-1-1]|uniref:glycosyltransferase n=1 Tax=Massilia sp. DWR3-1-1 TaxID=2804559 RepID=UPI003CE71D61
MRIVIDMQGAQASNRQRGIGRYVMALTHALVRQRGPHEIVLALNGAFADTIEPLRAAFDASLGQDAIRVWDGAEGVAGGADDARWRRGAAELVRETFLAGLAPDVVLVSSLFEGLGDDAVTSIGALGAHLPTAVILYDLIPLIRRQPYLDNPVVEAWYENKLDHLRRADLLLAISASSRGEALEHLGVPAAACTTISTAADGHFVAGTPAPAAAAALRQRYGLARPYLMYTGGIDHRKNVEGLIGAYALLPPSLRQGHQLAIVCSVEPAARQRLTALARSAGLHSDELVLTGYVPEADLVALYQLCAAFVFPSLHEGFGLPALEAMSCGRAVIAANTSSLPEVVKRADALFDPHSAAQMAQKIAQVLGDADFRAELERHGLERAQAFSWDTSAQTALAALLAWHERVGAPAPAALPARRLRLAFVSPLPPARSGIADYSAELLPELARHYNIDVIVDQPGVATPWIRANCGVRNSDWLRQHGADYDRVLYHFGNSDHHQHMFGLLDDVPGVVVLHDFFLSGISAHMEVTGYRPGYWARALYDGHGYGALQARFHAADTADVVWAYPCNLAVLQRARQLIVHSDSSRRLAAQWYGEDAARDWAVIALLRAPHVPAERTAARRALDLADDAFVVCSFGMLGPSKLNRRLLDAWLASPLAADSGCVLVFVGDNPVGEYGAALQAAIDATGAGDRIRITGWTDMTVFRQWLSVADMAVQLRTRSRGETSAAVLDCMNYGLPTIVNANGSMADLPDDGVCKLADDFDDAALVDALTRLWRAPAQRAALGERARAIIGQAHAPRHCADQYAHVIEAAYAARAGSEATLKVALAQLEHAPAQEAPWIAVAAAAAAALAPRPARRQLLVDISELVQRDARSGIQRVVRSILRELLARPPHGFQVEPVYATAQHGYRYARRYTQGVLDCPPLLDDAVIDPLPGDIFLGLDLQPHVVAAHRDYYQRLRARGVQVHFVIYDLLPVILPDAFGRHAAKHHGQWLEVVTAGDGALCISAAVADEVRQWMGAHGVAPQRPFHIGVFHLGADIAASAPSAGLPDDADTVLAALAARPTFLMVGTLEPRKSHAQALAAFELLWKAGQQVNLVIVGKQGWLVDALVRRLRGHKESGRRLFWLEAISDEYLQRVYAASACLLAASLGEGFGLPLIEAAQQGLPIIARDIPVFVEVAGEHAFYFSGTSAADLADSISAWLALHARAAAPPSTGMPWLTWADSARQLLAAIDRAHAQAGAAARGPAPTLRAPH